MITALTILFSSSVIKHFPQFFFHLLAVNGAQPVANSQLIMLLYRWNILSRYEDLKQFCQNISCEILQTTFSSLKIYRWNILSKYIVCNLFKTDFEDLKQCFHKTFWTKCKCNPNKFQSAKPTLNHDTRKDTKKQIRIQM